MWALVNSAAEYGITWHVMAAGIDTGDILVTEPVSIGVEDTAVSLNTKCFTAALDSFPRLLSQLTADALDPRAQDLSRRTYYGRAHHPKQLGLIDWRDSGENIDRLVRGLNTGRYVNTLGTPKLLITDVAYSVSVGRVRNDAKAAQPGTVVSVDDSALLVACGTSAF